ncbi:hypothetical protein KJ810_00015 [Patescibacteria group bacterium]|nr:hypothetical protein [Patescibacteria group bacterium]
MATKTPDEVLVIKFAPKTLPFQSDSWHFATTKIVPKVSGKKILWPQTMHPYPCQHTPTLIWNNSHGAFEIECECGLHLVGSDNEGDLTLARLILAAIQLGAPISRVKGRSATDSDLNGVKTPLGRVLCLNIGMWSHNYAYGGIPLKTPDGEQTVKLFFWPDDDPTLSKKPWYAEDLSWALDIMFSNIARTSVAHEATMKSLLTP